MGLREQIRHLRRNLEKSIEAPEERRKYTEELRAAILARLQRVIDQEAKGGAS
jgi:ribosome recycling factor